MPLQIAILQHRLLHRLPLHRRRLRLINQHQVPHPRQRRPPVLEVHVPIHLHPLRTRPMCGDQVVHLFKNPAVSEADVNTRYLPARETRTNHFSHTLPMAVSMALPAWAASARKVTLRNLPAAAPAPPPHPIPGAHPAVPMSLSTNRPVAASMRKWRKSFPCPRPTS